MAILQKMLVRLIVKCLCFVDSSGDSGGSL